VNPRVRRGLIASGIAVALLVVLGVAGTLLLGSHHAPAPLALNSPAPAAGAPNSLAGKWTVAGGSEAGYRVREQFVNQPAPTEAVARTTKVSGGLQVQSAGGAALKASGLHITVDLAALQSQDKYATFQAYQRDFFIRTIYLETGQYPNADFKADAVTMADGIGSAPVSVTLTGTLAVHGVTKPVTTQLQVQLNGAQLEAAGSMTVDMRDFNVMPPDISFTKAEPAVVIEYHLLLVHA
jgi:polyisoprenoid-binding protein YceI